MKPLSRFFLLITLVSLSACQGSVLYFDDFSNPSSGWQQMSGPGGGLEYLNDGYVVRVTADNYDLWSVSGQSYRDVQVETDATPLMEGGLSRFGLICRYQGPHDFYFFVVTGDGYYALGKVKDGVRTFLGQEMYSLSPAVILDYTQNHLRFDCIGKTLTGYANSQQVASVQDADFTRGDAGILAGSFESGGADVFFDNFVVYKP